MFFCNLTIAINGFSMVFLFFYHRFQWFSMVPDHWSNDAMVSMDRRGLEQFKSLTRNITRECFSKKITEERDGFWKNEHLKYHWKALGKEHIWIFKIYWYYVQNIHGMILKICKWENSVSFQILLNSACNCYSQKSQYAFVLPGNWTKKPLNE